MSVGDFRLYVLSGADLGTEEVFEFLFGFGELLCVEVRRRLVCWWEAVDTARMKSLLLEERSCSRSC